jgi:EpsI family protein
MQAPATDAGLSRRAVLLGAGCFGAAALGAALRPGTHMAAAKSQPDLERLLPVAFGSWRVDTSVVPLTPSPDVVEKIEKIYDATLARTYTNGVDRVMLSIAYGGDQSGRLRVHRPEACYSAQGFFVKTLRQETVDYGARRVEVRRLMARLGMRDEPITYWIRVGDETVASNLGQRLVQFRHSLTSEITDGLIFRVSTLGSDSESAYRVQDRFIGELLAALDPAGITVLAGNGRSA